MSHYCSLSRHCFNLETILFAVLAFCKTSAGGLGIVAWLFLIGDFLQGCLAVSIVQLALQIRADFWPVFCLKHCAVCFVIHSGPEQQPHKNPGCAPPPGLSGSCLGQHCPLGMNYVAYLYELVLLILAAVCSIQEYSGTLLQ